MSFLCSKLSNGAAPIQVRACVLTSPYKALRSPHPMAAIALCLGPGSLPTLLCPEHTRNSHHFYFSWCTSPSGRFSQIPQLKMKPFLMELSANEPGMFLPNISCFLVQVTSCVQIFRTNLSSGLARFCPQTSRHKQVLRSSKFFNVLIFLLSGVSQLKTAGQPGLGTTQCCRRS